MNLINKTLHKILTGLSISVFVLLVIDVCLGVGSRYLIGNQIRWTEELAIFLLVWLVFCGAAIAYHDNSHLGIDLVMKYLDRSAYKIAAIFRDALILAFILLVMVWGGTLLTLERFDSGQMMSTLGIHKAWLYLSLPLNGFFMAMFNVGMLVEHFKSNRSDDVAEEVAS